MAALGLIEAFLGDALDFPTLFERYRAFFLGTDRLDQEVFLFLDGIWADLDVTTNDPPIIERNPAMHLDEAGLKAVLARKLAEARQRWP